MNGGAQSVRRGPRLRPNSVMWLRLAAVLAAAWLSAGCARMFSTQSALPERRVLVREPLVIHSDFEVPAHHRLVNDLQTQGNELIDKLALPKTDEPIHVYLFKTAAGYNDFMENHYPEFPLRRAFFIETDTRLAVFAYWGDRVAEDLRHEVAHGYLHAAVPGLPLWLDEGLAEYFEVPRGHGGLNQPHVAELLAAHDSGLWQADLRRLEQLESAAEMTQLDYAESWAWVHLLLETTPERRQTLRETLDALRTKGSAQRLSERIGGYGNDPGALLVAHLASLAAAR